MNELISIIIPVYNVEKYLERCIESVINQTLKNIEIILVNDGSTDSSPKICDYYASRDSRIKVIHKINEGLGSARNAGLDIANGLYIGFLDSDDYINKDMYELLYTELTNKKVDICGCFFNYRDKENKLVVNITEQEKKLCKIYDGRSFLELLYEGDYANGICVSIWNKLYNRRIWNDIRFNNTIYEDDQICTRIYLNNYKVSIIDSLLYIYVQNENSITNTKFSAKNLCFLDILEERTRIFKNEKLKNLYIKTIKLYLNINIEYYLKIKRINSKFNYLKHKKVFIKNLFNIVRIGDISKKELLRWGIFVISPKVYQYMLKIKELFI